MEYTDLGPPSPKSHHCFGTRTWSETGCKREKKIPDLWMEGNSLWAMQGTVGGQVRGTNTFQETAIEPWYKVGWNQGCQEIMRLGSGFLGRSTSWILFKALTELTVCIYLSNIEIIYTVNVGNQYKTAQKEFLAQKENEQESNACDRIPLQGCKSCLAIL